jgi:hypothetical protein
MIVSIVVLWLAPVFYYLATRYAHIHRVIERILLIVLAAVVLINILPESFRVAGWWSIGFAVFGMLVPSLVERAWHGFADTVHWVPLGIGTIGLALHASLDGAAFVSPEHFQAHRHVLPMAVVVHRFFEGMFIWWMLKPRIGSIWTASILAFITVFTFVGYAAGDVYFHNLENEMAFAVFQAIVAGSLLHLAFDRHDFSKDHAHGHSHSHRHDGGNDQDHAHHHRH